MPRALSYSNTGNGEWGSRKSGSFLGAVEEALLLLVAKVCCLVGKKSSMSAPKPSKTRPSSGIKSECLSVMPKDDLLFPDMPVLLLAVGQY